MKKKYCIILMIFIVLTGCSEKTDGLTVYTYDSFSTSWIESFEEETGIKVNLIRCGTGQELYSKLIFEGARCQCDVAVGIPDYIKVDPIFDEWEPSCSEELVTPPLENGLIPFDYGIFAFVYNSDNCKEIPVSLWDFTKKEYKDKFILIDPRTSSVGLGLYLWTVNEFGFDNALIWWKEASENALTMASSWSSAYGLFTEGEADIVISYSTSPVYHLINEDNDAIKTVELKEPHIGTTEYLGILSASRHKEEAVEFCNYLLTKAQTDIALYNTMFPANTSSVLPEEFNSAKIKNITSFDMTEYTERINEYLDAVSEVLVR